MRLVVPDEFFLKSTGTWLEKGNDEKGENDTPFISNRSGAGGCFLGFAIDQIAALLT